LRFAELFRDDKQQDTRETVTRESRRRPRIGTWMLLRGLVKGFQWASWQQIRSGDNPYVKAIKKLNIISQIDKPTLKVFTTPGGREITVKDERADTFTAYHEPVSVWNKPSTITLKDPTDVETTFVFSKDNNKEMFSNQPLNDRLALSRDNEKDAYEAFKEMYKGENPLFDLINLTTREMIYPKKVNLGRNEIRNREEWDDSSNEDGIASALRVVWRNAEADRVHNHLTNSLGYDTNAGSVFALDDGTGNSEKGELNFATTGSIRNLLLTDNESNATASVQYYHLPYNSVSLNAPFGFSKTGTPAYDSYSDYAKDIKMWAKGYSLLPEFNISHHMDYYVDENGGNFRAENKNFLTLPGATISGSSQDDNVTVSEDFYKIYSHTDFMKSFSEVYDDHDEDDKNKVFSLTCRAVKKLLPQNGFYPMERALQAATAFSQSYAPALIHDTEVMKNPAAELQALVQPFFAPGIMFNSLRSGIACDWAIQTGSFDGKDNFFYDRIKNGQKPLAATLGHDLLLLDLPSWFTAERWKGFAKRYREDWVGFLYAWIFVGVLILLAWGILQLH